MLQLLLLASTVIIPAPTHPNLVVNGDFSAGNKGFKSDYLYSQDIGADGSNFVGSNPHDSHSGGAVFGDHTSGKGLMLLANGSANANTAVWEETVKVAPNHKYIFALWTATWSLSLNDGRNGDYSPARLVVYVNGKPINQPYATNVLDGVWTKLVATWSSGSAKTADIRIVDENLDQYGNDFAIDDIVFHS